MKKYLLIFLFLIIVILVGCSNDKLSGKKPPTVNLIIDGECYETTLGTYCWKNVCADTAGPVEILKGKNPIKVNLGTTISFEMNYQPKPNEVYLEQIREKEITLKDSSFTAPTKRGVYYYYYSAL